MEEKCEDEYHDVKPKNTFYRPVFAKPFRIIGVNTGNYRKKNVDVKRQLIPDDDLTYFDMDAEISRIKHNTSLRGAAESKKICIKEMAVQSRKPGFSRK